MSEEHLYLHQKPTPKQIELLKKFYKEGKAIEVRTVEKTQEEIASELEVTRQALNLHLKAFKELGYIRTGYGFIDLTEKALELLGEKEGGVFILIKVEPTKRRKVYESIKKLKVKRAYRVTGSVDLIIKVDKARLDEVLGELASLDGVMETRTHVVLESF